MNELEKAEAYDKAVEKARQEYNATENVERKQWLEELFPQLQENKDEKIVNEIISYLNSCVATSEETELLYFKRWITWLEKQGEQPSAIRWYDASLIPKEMEELLVEWDSEDATWHEIAFYHADTKTFWNGTRQVKNVTRWCYIIDLLKKQGEQKPIDYEKATITQKDFASVGETATIELSSPIDCGDRIYHVSHKPIEKNGEQKPFDYEHATITQKDFAPKQEPKFKVGDWITDGEAVFHITSYDIDYGYQLETQKGTSFHFSDEKVESKYHLWTIQDAKDGDVLVNGSNIFIFHFTNETRLMGYCHVNVDDGRFYDDMGKNECFCLIDAVVNPATKEQRDFLFQKMEEAGYQWNDEKKELKKVYKNPKFHVGDWVVCECDEDSATLQIKNIIYGTYEFTDDSTLNVVDEDSLRLWTIQDAKDGDVLVDSYGNVCIYQEPSTNLMYHSRCYANNKGFYDLGGSHAISNTYPATKEQCDILFTKMKEAGYEFDFDNKELKKIEDEENPLQKELVCWLKSLKDRLS